MPEQASDANDVVPETAGLRLPEDLDNAAEVVTGPLAALFEAEAAHGRYRAMARRAAMSAEAAARQEAERAESLAALREAAQWLGLSLLDAIAADSEMRLQLLVALLRPGRRPALGVDTSSSDEQEVAPEVRAEGWSGGANASGGGEASAASAAAAFEPVNAATSAQPTSAAPEKISLSPAQLQMLQAIMRGDMPSAGASTQAAGGPPRPRPGDVGPSLRALSALRTTAGGMPTPIGDENTYRSELAQLEGAVDQAATWRELEGEHRRLGIEWLAARLRNLQDHQELARGDDVGRVDVAMRGLTRLLGPKRDAGAGQPLFCHGLARTHRPQGGTWAKDATRFTVEVDQLLGNFGRRRDDPNRTARVDDDFRRLREASETGDAQTLKVLARDLMRGVVGGADPRGRSPLERHVAALANDADPELRRLAVAVVHALEEAQHDDDDGQEGAAVSPSWPLLERTRGQRLLLVGGDGRDERIPIIRRAFGLESVEWADLPKNAPRGKEALVARIRGGRFDFVVCLQRFISHELTDAVFGLEVEGVRMMLAQGYGIGQLRRCFERFLGRG